MRHDREDEDRRRPAIQYANDMTDYPEIVGPNRFYGRECIAFYKYDGSNLRFQWNKKTGWKQCKTRKRLVERNDPDFGDAFPLFEEAFADPLANLFKRKWQAEKAYAFVEYLGPYSFAGQHAVDMLNFIGIKCEHNVPKRLVLIDVNVHRKGQVDPERFVDTFAPVVPTAEVVYRGILDHDFRQSVYRGELPVKEGVVCKGGEGHDLWMCKIKTMQYLQELQERFPHDWKQYWDWENR